MTPIAPPEPGPSSLLARVAIGISIAVHLAAVALSLGYAGAGLFQGGGAEAVAVTVVTPEQVAAFGPDPVASPERKPEPAWGKLDLQLKPQDQHPPPPLQATNSPPIPAETRQPQPAAPVRPQPDVSIKYQVDLGLKEMTAAPQEVAAASKSALDFDAPAMSKADIDTANVAAFRAQLKKCAALPAAVAADDKVMIVLRARFTPEGRLAAAPILIEASASAKGPALMKAAVAALQSCQPHTTLPADHYAEWRVLDLRFTPQDFRKG